MNENEIRTAYANLVTAKDELYEVTEELINARLDLEAKKRNARAEGKIIGKNETEREDAARSLFFAEYKRVEDWEACERKVRLFVEMALLHVEAERTLLRVYELVSRAVLPTDIP